MARPPPTAHRQRHHQRQRRDRIHQSQTAQRGSARALIAARRGPGRTRSAASGPWPFMPSESGSGPVSHVLLLPSRHAYGAHVLLYACPECARGRGRVDDPGPRNETLRYDILPALDAFHAVPTYSRSSMNQYHGRVPHVFFTHTVRILLQSGIRLLLSLVLSIIQPPWCIAFPHLFN